MEKDTIELLRECDAGIQMGVASIDEVKERVRETAFQETLAKYAREHEQLQAELRVQLDRSHDQGMEPPLIAKGMSWMKTNLKLAADPTDATIADLMTDGCNMGVKSLSRYLNQYEAADEKAKALTGRLIGLEENMARDLRAYL